MAMGMASGGGGRGGRRGRRGRTPMAEINVTPLVDVMLVLLIIFMVTAPLLTAGVPIELPDSSANALGEESESIAVSMDAAGQIYVGEQAIAPGGFAEAVAGMGCGGDSARSIELRADRALDYGRVMAVMGELNRGGCNAIALVTNSSVTAP